MIVFVHAILSHDILISSRDFNLLSLTWCCFCLVMCFPIHLFVYSIHWCVPLRCVFPAQNMMLFQSLDVSFDVFFQLKRCCFYPLMFPFWCVFAVHTMSVGLHTLIAPGLLLLLLCKYHQSINPCSPRKKQTTTFCAL